MRRILLALAVVLVGSLGVVTIATADESGQVGETVVPPVLEPPATLAYSPGADASGVDPRASATVSVKDGTLDEVTLTGPDGKAVEGEPNAERTEWSSTAELSYGITYTWSGSATGRDGAKVPLQGSFTTLKPQKTVRGTINIGDGRTVGVAAPIRIQFNDHVDDRAAVERALSVETSVPVEGSWGWLPDEGGGSRVDWRPREYWPAYTKVTVTADLFGVPYGGGRYGATDVTSSFEIGRSQIVKADAASHRVVVVRDGKQVFDFPASFGLDSDPRRNTRTGVHVVTEKFPERRMVSQQFDYDVNMKWAVRISNNGEFLHAQPATVSQQGSANVSHGCINLSPDNAKAFYDTAIYGDPVEVTGTNVQMSARDGDIWDWTLSWDEWKALSALDG
ncbi:lipoprotein-anchoring transpeptidase ErfK/SrfK [Pseudonocardia hierapolitana]|uniref:Lipoprotein-anchoring transpeptidase ErfK/SrfK n=1 Tax=Pseudonocardia hierapolitana TaxID=1128676 RepID=A0A561SPK4_9PSEU|nr:Ig-like domain-containing protein [Pseudonocardia hierapolitana]TWF76783.1 lipoprotein-anchoring transpeptidase ErfK/SrfK [Pseudonocardia hierapolitana]